MVLQRNEIELARRARDHDIDLREALLQTEMQSGFPARPPGMEVGGPERLAAHDPVRGVVDVVVTFPAELPNTCQPTREPPESSNPGLTSCPWAAPAAVHRAVTRATATIGSCLRRAVSCGFTSLIVDLPYQVIYALSLGVAVRLIAAGVQLKDEELDTLVAATWRAVTRP